MRTNAIQAPMHGPVTHDVVHRPGRGRGNLPCWLAMPRERDSAAEPLVAVHGILRRADDQATLLGERAAASGRVVVAPLFDERRWPRYQQVVRGKRADLALLALMADLRLAGTVATRRFELVGYSGGAQFAHRFAMLYPHLVSRLTVVSAGWYTFPDAAPFPYGLAPRPGRTGDWGPQLAAGLEQFLRIPITVCVGAEDTERDDNLRGGDAIEAQQGGNRVTRATRWVAALEAAARAHGISPSIELVALPDCGHDFRQCVRRGGLDRIALGEHRAG
ncbi:MAG: hypothetical protein H6983_22820 [Ectothiorhodospiraceae bacterium]|nr:hypothetical protein [Chromatiales bacterium]MCP5157029.1 hypothetical protein [Ectothiorhodospiraceae bacterium]